MKLVVAALAALVLAGPAAACAPHASQAYLETRLVCIQCHTTLDESDSTFAVEMKNEIARQIKLCRSNQQIIASMVSQFGPSVLSTPQTHGFDLIAWVLPIGGHPARRRRARVRCPAVAGGRGCLRAPTRRRAGSRRTTSGASTRS